MNIKNTYKYQMGGFLAGASTGASLGSLGGPIGTAVGAIGGGLYGAISSNKAEDKLRQQQQEQYLSSIRDYSKSILQDYPSLGVEASGYYQNGGVAKKRKRVPKERMYDSQNYNLGGWLESALAENNEVAIASTPPEVYNGNLEPIASNVTKFKGDVHEDPSGGIEFNSTSDTMIFSDELRTEDGLTFAKKAEQIGKRKSKFEKKLENARSSPEYNTAERMIARVDSELSELFNLQESLKPIK